MINKVFHKKKFQSLPTHSQIKKIKDLWYDFLQSMLGSSEFPIAGKIDFSSIPNLPLIESFFTTRKITSRWISWMDNKDFQETAKKVMQKNTNPGYKNLQILVLAYDTYLKFCRQSNTGPDKKIIALIHNIKSADLKQCKTGDLLPWSFCLWNLRSAHNAGSITRTTDCMGLESVYLAGYTPGPGLAGFRSAAMGTQENVELKQIEDTIEHLKDLAKSKIIVGLETGENHCSIENFAWPKKGGIILAGNEETGLPEEILDFCTKIISIPLFGSKESLNVANACSICAWEIRKSYMK